MKTRNLLKLKDKKLTFENVNEHMETILKLAEMEKSAGQEPQYDVSKRKLNIIKDEKFSFNNMDKRINFLTELLSGNIIDDHVAINDDELISTIRVLDN